jgi:hypothetical protein
VPVEGETGPRLVLSRPCPTRDSDLLAGICASSRSDLFCRSLQIAVFLH